MKPNRAARSIYFARPRQFTLCNARTVFLILLLLLLASQISISRSWKMCKKRRLFLLHAMYGDTQHGHDDCLWIIQQFVYISYAHRFICSIASQFFTVFVAEFSIQERKKSKSNFSLLEHFCCFANLWIWDLCRCTTGTATKYMQSGSSWLLSNGKLSLMFFSLCFRMNFAAVADLKNSKKKKNQTRATDIVFNKIDKFLFSGNKYFWKAKKNVLNVRIIYK